MEPSSDGEIKKSPKMQKAELSSAFCCLQKAGL